MYVFPCGYRHGYDYRELVVLAESEDQARVLARYALTYRVFETSVKDEDDEPRQYSDEHIAHVVNGPVIIADQAVLTYGVDG